MKAISRTARTAFTLIELLVVIAIIAVLAAILFPVFSHVRENARTAACLSNMRQIALAASQYEQDYDESLVPYDTARSLPSAVDPSTGQSGLSPLSDQIAGSWVKLLQPYLKNYDVLFCPSFSIGQFNQGMANAYGQSYADSVLPLAWPLPSVPPSVAVGMRDGFLSDYSLLPPFGDGDPTPCGTANVPHYQFPGNGNSLTDGQWVNTILADVVNPTRTTFLTDGATGVARDATFALPTWPWVGIGRHKGAGMNMGFLDGHCRYFSGSDAILAVDQDPPDCYYFRYFTADK